MNFIQMIAVGDAAGGFCSSTANLWQVVGIFLLIFKIAIPIILIILGMFDLGKAVIASDDKAVSKAAKSLLMRVIAAICIFFIPTIVSFVIGLIGSFGSAKNDYDVCAKCVSNPYNPTCDGAADILWGAETTETTEGNE